MYRYKILLTISAKEVVTFSKGWSKNTGAKHISQNEVGAGILVQNRYVERILVQIAGAEDRSQSCGARILQVIETCTQQY